MDPTVAPPQSGSTEVTPPAAPSADVSWEADLSRTIADLPSTPQETPTRRISTESPGPKPPTPPKPPVPPKPDVKPAEPPKADDPAKPPGDKPPAEPDPEPDLTAQFKTAHDLRKEFHRISKLSKGYEAEIAKLKAERTTVPKDDPERKALSEKLSAAEKRMQEVESELRYANFTKSQEYKEKFEKPFEETLSEAYSTVKEFQIESEDGSVRQATTADFDRILELPLGEAAKAAKQWFGDLSPEIMAFRRKLGEIRRTAQKETERYRTEGSERETKRLQEMTERQKVAQVAWTQANEMIVQKYGQLFAPVDGDDEGNKRLQVGYAEVDKAHDPSLPVEERIQRQAVVRHRAAAFGRAIHSLKKAQARISELETALKAYEDSAPAGGSKDGAKPGQVEADPSDWRAEMDRMASGR